MARKSPVELQRLALTMYQAGHAPVIIADVLGLHPGSVRNLVENQSSCNTLRRETHGRPTCA